MKIVLIGICQVRGMAEALRAALPDAVVQPFHVTPKSDLPSILNEIRSADLTISQVLPSHKIPELTQEALVGVARRLEMVPPIVFRGFHPDSTIVVHQGDHLESPIRDYHSTILLAAYLMGLPMERAIRLYNSYILVRLGYDAAFTAAKAAFMRSLAANGLDQIAKDHWDEWISSGAFMHTPNHPKVHVLATFALEMARRADLPVQPIPPETQLDDILARQNAWAVHPDLARRIGVLPSPLFRAYRKPDEPEETRYFSLERFAEASYAIFARTPPEDLRAAAGVTAAIGILTTVLRDGANGYVAS